MKEKIKNAIRRYAALPLPVRWLPAFVFAMVWGIFHFGGSGLLTKVCFISFWLFVPGAWILWLLYWDGGQRDKARAGWRECPDCAGLGRDAEYVRCVTCGGEGLIP